MSIFLGALGFYLLQNLLVFFILIKNEWSNKDGYFLLYAAILLCFGSLLVLIEWVGETKRTIQRKQTSVLRGKKDF